MSPLIFDVRFNGPLQSHFLIPMPQSRNKLGLMEITSMQPNPTVFGLAKINGYGVPNTQTAIMSEYYTIIGNIDNIAYTTSETHTYLYTSARARSMSIIRCQEDKVCQVKCINRIVERTSTGKNAHQKSN
ncbi:hypothetical protein QTP88_012654 [Uroleucon formosanum]